MVLTKTEAPRSATPESVEGEAAVGSQAQIFETFLADLIAAGSAEEEWPLKVRAAIATTVDFAASRPEQCLILATCVLRADVALDSRVSDAHNRLAALLRGMRSHSHYAAQVPDCTEEFLVAAVAAATERATGSLLKGDAGLFQSLRADLIELTLIPYCGLDEAARIAHV
jgi:hypothetical protein